MNTPNAASSTSLLEVEKVIILKSTDLFSDTPEEILIEVAAIMNTHHHSAGETIFHKGNEGSSMFIIHEGTVSIHDGDKELAELERRDFFGELSLLDAETRSASATAKSDCLLLELSQDAFFDLLSERNEMSQGILRVLARRIRKDNAKIMQLSAANQKK